jgi:hypothetical protein
MRRRFFIWIFVICLLLLAEASHAVRYKSIQQRCLIVGYDVGALAELYETGNELPRDFKKAATIYGNAAENGDSKSQYRLARMYMKGLGVEQNYGLAYFWANIAVDMTQGDTKAEAKALADEANKHLTPLLRTVMKKQVHDWLADFHSISCKVSGLSHIDYKNLGHDIKTNKAAANRGDIKAQRTLAYLYSYAGDYEDAFFWAALAEDGPKCGVKEPCVDTSYILKDASKHLTLQKVTSLMRRAAQWKPTKSPR